MEDLLQNMLTITPSDIIYGRDVYFFSSSGGASALRPVGAPFYLQEGKEVPAYGILSWYPSYGELTIQNLVTGKKYIYVGMNDRMVTKLRFYERKKWFGKGWQILKNCEFRSNE